MEPNSSLRKCYQLLHFYVYVHVMLCQKMPMEMCSIVLFVCVCVCEFEWKHEWILYAQLMTEMIHGFRWCYSLQKCRVIYWCGYRRKSTNCHAIANDNFLWRIRTRNPKIKLVAFTHQILKTANRQAKDSLFIQVQKMDTAFRGCRHFVFIDCIFDHVLLLILRCVRHSYACIHVYLTGTGACTQLLTQANERGIHIMLSFDTT